jgi:hypothetical protein
LATICFQNYGARICFHEKANTFAVGFLLFCLKNLGYELSLSLDDLPGMFSAFAAVG